MGLELSLEEARQLGHNYIGTEHLLLGLIREGEGVAARVLENLGVDLAKVRTQVIRMLGETAEVSAGGGGGGGKGSTKTPTLDEFGNNLTQLATEAKLDPVVGRQNEMIASSRSWGAAPRTTLFSSVSPASAKPLSQ